MKESDYVLACNVKSCREIKGQIDEMVLESGVLEEKALEARRLIHAIEVDLMAILVIEGGA